jgi:hypothetical protein
MVLWTESGQVRGQALCRSKLGDYGLVHGYRGKRPANIRRTENVLSFTKYYATARTLANWCSDRNVTY